MNPYEKIYNNLLKINVLINEIHGEAKALEGIKAKPYEVKKKATRKPWTADDIKLLRDMYDAGFKDEAIMEKTGRTKLAIQQKRFDQGMVDYHIKAKKRQHHPQLRALNHG